MDVEAQSRWDGKWFPVKVCDRSRSLILHGLEVAKSAPVRIGGVRAESLAAKLRLWGYREVRIKS